MGLGWDGGGDALENGGEVLGEGGGAGGGDRHFFWCHHFEVVEYNYLVADIVRPAFYEINATASSNSMFWIRALIDAVRLDLMLNYRVLN